MEYREAIINMDLVKFNKDLGRSTNVYFFLNIKAYMMNMQKPLRYLIHTLSDDNISRIMWEDLSGINIQEDIVGTVIVPAWIYSLAKNKSYLITPNFRIMDYAYLDSGQMVSLVKDIVREICYYIIDRILRAWGETKYGNMPFVTNEVAEEFEASVGSILNDEINKYVNPSMELYFQSINNSFNIFSMYKTEFMSMLFTSLLNAFDEVGYMLTPDGEMTLRRHIEAEMSL